MRTGRIGSWFISAVERLRVSPRRVWWTTFAFVTVLSGLWGIANPPFAAPDEPAHVNRAVALDHGELTGDTPSRRLRRELVGAGDNLVVRVPEVLARSDPGCFAFKPDVAAGCLSVTGSSRDTDSLTTAGRHPPAYYGVVGLVSLVYPPGVGTVYLMRFVGALMTGAFIATAMTALRRTAAPKLVAGGLLVAITPMVLFVSGTVNPSVPEIAASLALWVCGLVLVSEARERVDNRLVISVGISACVLVLSRQLGPLWLGLIALTICASTNRFTLRNLARSSLARLWGGLVAACVLAQVGWVLVVKPLDATLLGRTKVDASTSEIVRASLGATFGRYREMIGVFGWLDTPSPALTYLLWTAAIAFLVLLAVMVARRRQVLLILGLVIATIVVPIVLEVPAYRDVGAVFWQGRYTLPLAVGVPILAAMSIATTERGRRLAEPRVSWVIGGIVVLGSTLAFAQNLRRYAVGYNGDVWYWLHPQWSPPISSLLLTVGYVIAMVVFVAWTLVSSGAREPTPEEAHAEVGVPVGGEPQLTSFR
jgi:Predicted membrane protein (DUF2142)